MKKYLLLSLLGSGLALQANDQPAPAPVPPAARPTQHFLIILHLVPRLQDEKAWTDADNAAVAAHFNRLKLATGTGQVLLAGRTEEPLDRTLGLIVFSAADEAAARDFMAADPCVAAGVMTAELRPYAVALRAK